MKCDQYLFLQLILSTLHLNPIFDFGFAFLICIDIGNINNRYNLNNKEIHVGTFYVLFKIK